MPYGLKDKTLKDLATVFSHYREVETAILYGSRAKGTYKPTSDIDITLTGNRLQLSLKYKIAQELDDLFLPYTIDLSLFEKINNSNIKKEIETYGKIIYTKIK